MGRERPAFFQMWHLVQYIISKTLGQIGSELEPGKKVKIRWLLSMKSLLSFFFFLWFRYIWLLFDASQHQNLTHCNFANVTLHHYERVCPSISLQIWTQQPRSGLSNQDLASATKIRPHQHKSGLINTNLA